LAPPYWTRIAAGPSNSIGCALHAPHSIGSVNMAQWRCMDRRVGPSVLSRETKVREDRTTGRRGRELEGQEEAEGLIAQLNGKGDSSRSNLKIPPPPPLRVLYANAVIFLYTLPSKRLSLP
jgi:hypothetical protein